MSVLSYILYIFNKYNVEPVFFFYTLGRNCYFQTPLTQLFTDKICSNSYDLDNSFCYYLDKYKDTQAATDISKDTVNYVMYEQLIISIPSIFAALFLGPWLDLHGYAPKIVLYLTVFAGLIESGILIMNLIFFDAHPAFLLISFILSGLSGANMLMMTASFVISTKETPISERTFRFTVMELAMVLASPVANFYSSLILPLSPWLVDNQTRNYLPLILTSFIAYFIALLWVILFIHETKDVNSPDYTIRETTSLRTLQSNSHNEYLTIKANGNQHSNKGFENDLNNNFIEPVLDTTSMEQLQTAAGTTLVILNPKLTNENPKGLLESLFQLKNATAMFKSLAKKRDEDAHILLWLTISIYVLDLVCITGTSLITLPFVTTTYGMSQVELLRAESVYSLVYGFLTTFLLSFLHRMNVSDTLIMMLGLIELVFMSVFRGAIKTPVGLYLSMIFGFAFLSTIIACRSFVSKIIPQDEMGTVLGILSVFYATTPILASFMYTQIYRLTIEVEPGLAFLIGAGITGIITLSLNVYLHIKYNTYKAKMDAKRFITSA